MKTAPLELAGVPTLLLQPEPAGDAQIVLFWFHGWGGHKGTIEQPLEPLRRLVDQGVTVICPDAPLHGQRIDPSQEFRRTFNGWAYICDIMEQAANETTRMSTAWMSKEPNRSKHFWIGGVSMGGVIAQLAYPRDARWSRLISANGRSSLHQADDWCREAQRGSRCEKWADAHAPLDHPERYVRGEVLFLDGGQDTDCPATLNAETVRRINRAGGSARQVVDPQVGHYFSDVLQDAFVKHAGAFHDST